MIKVNENRHYWEGKHLKVDVLYSSAGIAQQIIVTSEEGLLLVDTGDGTLRDILSKTIDRNRIRGIIFTHGHFDHVGGLHSLLGFLRMTGRNDPLPIFYPAGCKEVTYIINSFKECYSETLPFDISCTELESGINFEIFGLNVKTYPVIHCGGIKGHDILDPIPALGYRISYRDESVAITGDTGNCPSLRELVRDADLALIEATFEKDEKIDKELIERVHLSSKIATELGKLARDFILIHRVKKFKGDE